MEFAQRLPRHGVSRPQGKFPWWEFPRFSASMMANISPLGDARRQQYFLAQVSRGNFVIEPSLLTREQLEAELQKAPHLPIFASAPIEFLPKVILRTP